MALIPQWHDEEKTVFLFHYTTSLTSWQEYWDSIEEGLQEINTVQHPVIVLFDPYSFTIPSGNPFPHLRKAINLKPPHVIAIVTISTNRFISMVIEWVKKVGLYQWLYIVTTEKESDELIAQLKADAIELDGIANGY